MSPVLAHAKLRHPTVGRCELVRVEATDWIIRADRTGIFYRIPPEKRSEFEVVRETIASPEPNGHVKVPRPGHPRSIDARRSRRVIEALRCGLPSFDGAGARLAVGFDDIEGLMARFLNDVKSEGGGAMVMKGAYGQGKTFALNVLDEMARSMGFITAKTEIDASENRLTNTTALTWYCRSTVYLGNCGLSSVLFGGPRHGCRTDSSVGRGVGGLLEKIR